MAKRAHSPMFWRCMARVRQIAGEDLTDSELEELAKQLLARARAIRAERYGMTADEAVDKALKEMSEELVTKSQLKKRNTLLINAAFTRELGTIQSSWGDNPRAGLQATLVGSNIARRGAQKSVDADQKGLANEWRAGFYSDVERTGKHDIYKTGDLDQDVYRALGEMYKDDPNFTGIDRDAREFAEVIYKYQELYRVSANHAGAFIAKLPDYITHQSHDMFKVRTAERQAGSGRGMKGMFNYNDDANFAAWRDFVMPRLDRQRTFSGMMPEDQEGWLRAAWLAIATGEHLGDTISSTNGFKTTGSLANKLSAERILHFKDADARFEYDQKFGRGGSLYERIMHQMGNGAHNVALMRRFGPNPHETFTRLKNAVRLLTEASVENRISTKWQSDEQILDAYFDEVTGIANLPGTSPVATALRAMRLIQTVSKLGGAVISSVVDLAVSQSELRYQGFTATEAWATQWDAIFQGYGKRGKVRAERMQLASELGIAIDVMRSAVWSRFSAEDALPGWAARAQHMFFQLNGLMWWTDTLRMANAQAMSNRIASFATRALPELDADTQRLFKLFNITSDEWDLMRSRSISTVENREYFTPKGATRLTDVEIAYLLQREGHKATPRRVAERRTEIQTKFRDLFATRSEYAVISPGPRSRSFMTGSRIGIKRGSTAMEIMRSLSQFKGFPAALIEKVWGRDIFGYGESGRIGDATNSGMMGLANFLVFSTFLGLGAMYMKAFFNGRRINTPETPEESANLFLAAFLQGGGAGIYGDFLFGEARDRYGQSSIDALLGPSFGMTHSLFNAGREAMKTPFDIMFEKAKEGDENWGSAFFAVKNNFPLINLFYTRMALDYLFLYRLQENIAPGSLKKTEKAYERNLNQSFKLPPSKHYRAEDLSTEDIAKLLNPL